MENNGKVGRGIYIWYCEFNSQKGRKYGFKKEIQNIFNGKYEYRIAIILKKEKNDNDQKNRNKALLQYRIVALLIIITTKHNMMKMERNSSKKWNCDWSLEDDGVFKDWE